MVGPKYVKPTVPHGSGILRKLHGNSFKESDEWKPAQPSDQNASRQMVGDSSTTPQLNALEEETDGFQTRNLKSGRVPDFRQGTLPWLASTAPREFSDNLYVAPALVQTNESPQISLTSRPSLVNNGTGAFTLPFDFSYEVDLWGESCAVP